MGVSLAIAALEALSGAAKLLPNVEQSKRNKLFYLLSEYKRETVKPTTHPLYSSARIDYLYDELRIFVEVFAKEIR